MPAQTMPMKAKRSNTRTISPSLSTRGMFILLLVAALSTTNLLVAAQSSLQQQSLGDLWSSEAEEAQNEAERILRAFTHMSAHFPTENPTKRTNKPTAVAPTLATLSPTIRAKTGIPNQHSILPTRTISPPPSSENCLVGTTRKDYLLKRLSLVTPLATLQDPTTPQGKAFAFISTQDPFNYNVCTYPTLEQRYGLAAFFFATGGFNWLTSTGWMGASNECTWFGVICMDKIAASNITLRKQQRIFTSVFRCTALMLTHQRLCVFLFYSFESPCGDDST
jgi:hypothetical protein